MERTVFCLTRDMTSGSPGKMILQFSIPLFLGYLFQQLYSMVDTVIVGRWVGENALAAVGSTGAISFLVMGFVMGVSSGFAVVTSQRFGAENREGVRRSVGTSIWLCVIIAVLLTLLSVLTARPLLVLMNTPENIIEDAAAYILIIYLGIGATIYYNAAASILRALGDSRTPLYFLILSSFLNIGLDLLFILSFSAGVAGAALATVISQLVSAILCTFYAIRKYPILRLKKEDFQLQWHTCWAHLRIGLPMALQFSVTAIGVMVLQGALNLFGSTAIAAYTAASKVEMLVTQPFNAFGTTMATYCGQNRGAGSFSRIRKGMRIALLFTLITCFVAALINFLLGEAITRLFLENPTPEILQYSQQYLNTVAIFYPLLGILFLFRNGLQGMGEALMPFLGGVGELAARFLVATLLPPILGYAGICLASPAAWLIPVVLLVPRYCLLMGGKKDEAPMAVPQA